MKKQLKAMSMMLATAAMLASCSSDDVVTGNDNDPSIPEDGLTAYLSVNISDAGQMMMSRGNDWDNDQVDGAENGDYIHGDDAEHKVQNARFFFYDENGIFVKEASVWKDGGPGDSENIECLGDNLLVLQGLTKAAYPPYMLTALNLPEDFNPGNTLDETRAKLMDLRDSSGRFIMSTSSYVGESDKYGTNKLTDDNFKVAVPGSTPTIADGDKVNVYVERLAAKIQVVSEVTENIATDADGKTYYRLPVNVAGNENNEGGDNEGVSEIYIHISNWGLNATPSQTYLTKNIDGFTETGADAPFASWNYGLYHRSFWGKSVVYGSAVDGGNLNYIALADAKNKLGDSDYTHEHTNTVVNILAGAPTAVSTSKTTSVVFSAQAFEKVGENEFKPLEMVRFNGVLYRTDHFLAYALNSLNAQQNGAKLNYWKQVDVTVETSDGEGGTIVTTTKKWAQMDASDLKVVLDRETGAATGMVYVKSDLKADDAVKYHTRSKAEGATEYTYTEATFDQTAIDALNASLRGFYNDNEKLSVANAFTEGKMFYSIPVEHLVKRNSNDDDIALGNYGVVRNHWYRVAITKVATVGKGIFKPGDDTTKGEDIIPDDDDEKIFHLGANVSILSWKIVTQKVEL